MYIFLRQKITYINMISNIFKMYLNFGEHFEFHRPAIHLQYFDAHLHLNISKSPNFRQAVRSYYALTQLVFTIGTLIKSE